jgi:integrase
MPQKITEAVRARALKRVDGKLVPSVTKDGDIKGFALVVTTQRAFWCLFFRPKGVNPATGKRWGGGVRHELGDAFLTSLADARAEALKAKGQVRKGHDPHRQAMFSVAAAVAERAVLPTTLADTLDTYEKALMARREPKEKTRREYVYYARKAVSLMKAEELALEKLDTRMVRLMVETAEGSAAWRRHLFGSLSRFLAWARRLEMIAHNPCDALDRGEQPKPGRARERVPSVKELRAIWSAVEDEPQCDLVRFLLLTPLRLREAGALVWSEVDFDHGRVLIMGRTKNGETHELPLAPRALAILESRWKVRDVTQETTAQQPALVFASTALKPYEGFSRLVRRIRARIGQKDAPKAQRFTFHDIRRAFVSSLAERGYDVDLLDQMLGHTRKGVLGVYQRASRMAERKAAMSAWASLVLEEAPVDNVVQLAARR